MTAREFVAEYAERLGVPEEKMLHMLDEYLTGTATVRYSEFPDANLPEDFLEDGDEPAAFEELIEENLKFEGGVKMKFNREHSQAIYRAAFQAMTEHSRPMDVIFDPHSDGTARPVASGCAREYHAVVMENVQPSDFGPDFDPETCTEDEFVDMCMTCFGNVEI
jgi:hypothetical protein